MKQAGRVELMGATHKYDGLTHIVNGHRVWTGEVRMHESALSIPLKTKKPTLWFVNSMSDLFHEGVTKEWFLQIADVMAITPQHTYQVLTKRPERMAAQVSQLETAKFEHVWWGTSVGMKLAKERIEHLRDTPAKTRFLSCEPLLEDLGELDLSGIHWVIVGGESGVGARPMEVEWAENILRQCREQGVKFFCKQMGGVRDKRGDLAQMPESLRVREMPEAQ